MRRCGLSHRLDGSATLPAALLQQLIDGARLALPNESVGLLVAPSDASPDAGQPTRFIDLENVAHSPHRYEIDSRVQARLLTQLEREGETIWAIVHSHVASPAVPSSADLRNAFYPDSLYLICSLAEPVPVVRAWRIRDGEVTEVALAIG